MTTEQATRAAIVAAVRAFVTKVKGRQWEYWAMGAPSGESWRAAVEFELAALERAAAEGAPEGGSQETQGHE
jgi:hypothetical protein